jgi:hypothetical protein
MSVGLDLVTGRRLAGERDRLFYGGMALAIALTIFAGFARTYYLKDLFGSRPLPPLVHLHGLLFTCWILLFAVQTSLISAGRPDIHRKTGIAGALLAAAMVVALGAAGLPVVLGVADLFIVACLVYDKIAHGRVHPAFLWGGLALVLSLPVRLAVSGSAPWLSLARWLTS